jgi:hypothetical protein
MSARKSSSITVRIIRGFIVIAAAGLGMLLCRSLPRTAIHFTPASTHAPTSSTTTTPTVSALDVTEPVAAIESLSKPTGWVKEIIDSNPQTGVFSTLVVNNEGNPFVAYWMIEMTR